MAINKRIIKSNDGGAAVATSFNTLTYTGDGGGNRSITGLGFEPDMVWIKRRDAAAFHALQDSVRGANVMLFPNAENSEQTNQTSGHVNSFDSDGFTVDAAGGFNTNGLNGTYVAWCWKAGGAAVTNTDGTITSQVSANTEAGFSILNVDSNSAGTIGHGLGVAPDVIIRKSKNSSSNWLTYHSALGEDYRIELNLTNGKTASSSWSNTAPTSSIFTIGSIWGGESIYYCFAEVAGFSKFGSYNGSVGSKTVDVGFEPAFVMIKNTNFASEDWFIADNKRTGDPSPVLKPNLSNADQINVATDIDFYSTGFILDGEAVASAGLNDSAGTYIYMAFANQF